jgi:hypothetical protein
MNPRTLTFQFILGVLISLSALNQSAAADSAAEKRYPLPNRGYFQLKVPADWTDRLDQPPIAVPPTINFGPRQGKAFIVSVTPAWRMRPEVHLPTKESIRERVELALQGIIPFAVEKDIKLVEFDGPSGPGFYFFATDSAPRPGEYKFMTQGALAVGELSVLFTILTNEGQDDVIRDALAMVRSAEHLPR